jgi:hypothetical protein
MAAYFQPMSYIRSSMEEGRFGLMGLLKCLFGDWSFNGSAADGLSARNRIYAIIAYLQSIQVK